MTTIICTKCGGIKTGNLRSSVDFYCKCPYEKFEAKPNYFGMMGWVCPVCGKGNSPYSSQCNCQPYKVTFTQTGNTKEEQQ